MALSPEDYQAALDRYQEQAYEIQGVTSDRLEEVTERGFAVVRTALLDEDHAQYQRYLRRRAIGRVGIPESGGASDSIQRSRFRQPSDQLRIRHNPLYKLMVGVKLAINAASGGDNLYRYWGGSSVEDGDFTDVPGEGQLQASVIWYGEYSRLLMHADAANHIGAGAIYSAIGGAEYEMQRGYRGIMRKARNPALGTGENVRVPENGLLLMRETLNHASFEDPMGAPDLTSHGIVELDLDKRGRRASTAILAISDPHMHMFERPAPLQDENAPVELVA